MKKFFKILLITILVILTILIVTPLLFKKQILNKAIQVANETVHARVDFADLKLSLFKNFPRLTVTLEELSVINLEPFEGDTLVAFKEFSAAVNVMSLIKGDAIEVKSILLDRAHLSGKILEDGTANWDIAPESDEVTEEDVDTAASGSMAMKIALKKFEIRDMDIFYDDQSTGMKAGIENFNFLLSGDLSEDFTSINIQSETERINFYMDGIRYLKNATLKMSFDIDADLANSVFTLKKNSVAINAFELQFDGKVAMPDEETIDVDMTFNSPATGFKSLLSMVPAVYMQDFEQVETDGALSFSGDIKGIMKGEQTPSANIHLLVENARFAYPDLPKSAENINIDVKVAYDGVQNDNTVLDVNRFHVELGGNPVDFNMHLITPMSDPQVNAKLMANLDFSTLADVVPMEGVNLKGILVANVELMGSMSMIENEQFEAFQAEGTINLQQFELNSPDIPQPVNIRQTILNFSPQFVDLVTFDATIGSSDLHLDGKLENFIPYVFEDGTVIGSLNLTSNLIDVNEFMTGEPTEETEVIEDTTAMSVVEVPGNIDFTMVSKLNKVKYDQMEIDHIDGLIIIRDQKVIISNLSMNLLQGSMKMSGEYNTQDMTTPMVDFNLDVSKIDIPSAFNAFNTVKQLVPVAERATGNVSTKFTFTSFLDEQMNPVMNSIVGGGRLMSNSIEINNSKTFEKVGEILKSDKFKVIAVQDVDLDFEIREGRIWVEPFDTKIAGNKVTIQGDQGLDQTMNYQMKMAVPRSQLGSGAGSALDGLTGLAGNQGVELDFGNELDVAFNVTGTFDDPKVRPQFEQGAGAMKDQVVKQAKERVEQEVEQVKEDVKEEVNKQAEKILADAQVQADKVKEEARIAGEKLVKEAKEQGDKLISEAGSNPIKKRLAEESAKKLNSEAEKKAKGLEDEADKKADDIMSAAQEKADKLK